LFWEHWLDPNLTDKGEAWAMIDSVPEPHLEPYEVGAAVNSPRNSDPSCSNRSTDVLGLSVEFDVSSTEDGVRDTSTAP